MEKEFVILVCNMLCVNLAILMLQLWAQHHLSVLTFKCNFNSTGDLCLKYFCGMRRECSGMERFGQLKDLTMLSFLKQNTLNTLSAIIPPTSFGGNQIEIAALKQILDSMHKEIPSVYKECIAQLDSGIQEFS